MSRLFYVCEFYEDQVVAVLAFHFQANRYL